jgi:hypothetical protein
MMWICAYDFSLKLYEYYQDIYADKISYLTTPPLPDRRAAYNPIDEVQYESPAMGKPN